MFPSSVAAVGLPRRGSIFAQGSRLREKVGPTPSRPLDRLFVTPAIDRCVVAAEQDVGHLAVVPDARAGVVRAVEQGSVLLVAGAEGVLGRRVLVSQDAGQESDAGDGPRRVPLGFVRLLLDDDASGSAGDVLFSFPTGA